MIGLIITSPAFKGLLDKRIGPSLQPLRKEGVCPILARGPDRTIVPIACTHGACGAVSLREAEIVRNPYFIVFSEVRCGLCGSVAVAAAKALFET